MTNSEMGYTIFTYVFKYGSSAFKRVTPFYDFNHYRIVDKDVMCEYIISTNKSLIPFAANIFSAQTVKTVLEIYKKSNLSQYEK